MNTSGIQALANTAQAQLQELHTQIDAHVEKMFNEQGKEAAIAARVASRKQLRPLADRFNTLLSLKEARSYLFRIGYNRIEAESELGINELFFQEDYQPIIDTAKEDEKLAEIDAKNDALFVERQLKIAERELALSLDEFSLYFCSPHDRESAGYIITTVTMYLYARNMS